MIKNRILFALLFLCSAVAAVAQNKTSVAEITGKVVDAFDNEPLAGVTIFIPELTEGTNTDENGNYQLTNLPQKALTLQVSFLGHQTIIKKVNLTGDQQLNFTLKESNAMLNEVVVSGLTGKSLMKDSPTPVSVVTSQQLRTTSSTNIIDALSKEPGLAQITTGSGISKPVIRGLGFNRLVVVNDGIRQEGNQWGAEHGIEIDPQSISSVEILKGPASLTYGSDALAGVIIFHGDPIMARNTMQANVGGEYQSNNGLLGYTANFSDNKNGFVWNGRWSQKIAHNYQNKIDNYVGGSQFAERAANMLLGVHKQWGYSHLTLDYYHLTPSIVEGERLDHYSYGKTLPFQQIHHYKAVLDNSVYLGQGTLHALVGYQQNRRQEFEESANEPGLDMQLHTINYDVRYLFPEQNGWKSNVGINGMWQRNNNRGDEFLIPSYQLFDIGAFATTSYQTGQWTLSGGLRYDLRHVHSFALDEQFERFTRNFKSLSGSLGAVYAINPQMNVRLNLAKGFRAPNLGELASNGVHEGTQQYLLGNKDLKPEQSWQIDAGWDYSSSWISAQISLFANFIDHYIFDHRLANTVIDEHNAYQYTQGNARLLGGEMSVDLHPIEQLHFQNTFSYVNSQQRHQPRETKYLPWTPAPRWIADLRYDLIRDGKGWLNNTYVGISMECNLRQNHFYAAQDTETATPSYTLVNLSAGTDLRIHKRRWATLSLNLNNLFNRAYQNHLSRLKYVEATPENGHPGIYNMGRNFGAKLSIYLF